MSLRQILDDHRPFHQAIQIDRFIVAEAGVTPWGMYRQAVREVAARWDAMKSDVLALREHELAIEEASGDSPRARLARARARCAMDSIERTLRDRMREFARFLALAEHFRSRFAGLTEDLREVLDSDEWSARFRLQAGRDLIAYGQFRPETVDLMWQLPPAERLDLWDDAVRERLRIAAAEHSPELPAVTGLVGCEDLRGMLDEEVKRLA